MGKTNPRAVARQKRRTRVHRKIRGTTEKPRLCVFRSLNNIYCQVIDDDKGQTMASASSMAGDIRQEAGHKGNVATAKKVGLAIAQAAKAAGVTKVVFDRNGFLYHGRIKALADGAREGGLEF